MAQRRFLVASSLARLIRKEQGIAGRIVEGYFPARPDWDHFVSLEPGHAYLILAPAREGAGEVEQTEVPRAQAEALLAVCAGKVGFECTLVPLRDGQQALLQRFVAPGVLDLLSVEFAAGEDADGFVPPAWFGPEVTQNPAYHRGSLARTGLPASEDIPLSNAMLEELLDLLEEGTMAAQLGRGASPNVRDDGSAQGPSEGAFSAEVPAPSVEGVEADGLMAGLAEALKNVQPTKPASATDDAPAREDAPAERARPRLLKGGWR
jgi:CYTH domain-containing protein